jgi:hypothetical protein
MWKKGLQFLNSEIQMEKYSARLLSSSVVDDCFNMKWQPLEVALTKKAHISSPLSIKFVKIKGIFFIPVLPLLDSKYVTAPLFHMFFLL